MEELSRGSGKLISYPAPDLCQGSDEDLLLRIGEIIFPGSVERPSGENGLRVWAAGDPRELETRRVAIAKFQTLLGALRAWRPNAGELRDEQMSGLGAGSVRDKAGNQWAFAGTAVSYAIVDGEIENFAENARKGIDASLHLQDALWLNGRANRTAAVFYMIHEYAQMEFDGTKGVRDALGITIDAQGRLTASANNLSPLDGGRHVKYQGPVHLTLDEQRQFAASLLRQWISRYGQTQG